MREILFRGKRTDNGEWVYGYYTKARYYLNGKEMHIIFASDVEAFPRCEFAGYEEVLPETVCQFTGLHDKNGRKIFEGDIIKCKVHEMNGYRVRRGVVEYHGVGFIMNLEPNSWYAQKNIPFDCEIIGNIYDNPELLKGGNKNV